MINRDHNRKIRRLGGMGCRLLASILLMTTFLGGCGNRAVTENPQREEIVIWTWDETFNVKAAKTAAGMYEEEHPDVQIQVITKEREEIQADVKNLLSAELYEDLPDIIMLEDYDVQEMLAQFDDEFVDLTDRMNYDKFVDYKRKLCSRNGRMYGIPFDSGTAALFYRVDLLAAAGYTEEDMQNLTWDRYIEIGEDVYRKTGIPMLTLDPTDFPLVRVIMQSCGRWYVGEDGATVTIENNRALYQAMEIYKQLLESNVGTSVNGWNEFISAFQQGKVASVISGGWIISNIKARPEQEGLWRIAPIPVLTGNQNAVAASNVGGSGWYVLKNSVHSEAATDFIIAMFGENDTLLDQLITEIGIVPAVKNPTVLTNYGREDPYFGGQQVTKLLTELETRIPVVNYGSKTYEIEDILEAEFQNVLVDDDLQTCLQRVQEKAEAVARE